MHAYNYILAISMFPIMSSTLNPNLRMTQVGILCSRAKRYPQRYQLGYFCQGLFSAIQLSEIQFEIFAELFSEMLFEILAEMLGKRK